MRRPEIGVQGVQEGQISDRFGPGRRALEWWWRLTSPTAPQLNASFAERERARRGRLISVLLLLGLLLELGAFYQYIVVDDDHPLMVVALWVMLMATLVAALLNRRSFVRVAGVLLVVLADLPLAGIPATAVDGRLDVLHLPAFYLLVGSEMVAASVLAPWSVFPVALANSVLVNVSIIVLPHTPALAQVLASNNAQQVYAGPVVMQGIVALVAYLWASSVHTALRRADRAEEIAELERREVARTHELEEGVQHLLSVHVRMANGDFNARVLPVRDPLLWRVGASLNNLIVRFARLAQMEFLLQRTEAEAHRLAEAIVATGSGRQTIWPAPAGTPLDEVLMALARARSGPLHPPAPRADGESGVQSGTSSGILGMASWSGVPAGGMAETSRPREDVPTQPAPDYRLELPEWLR